MKAFKKAVFAAAMVMASFSPGAQATVIGDQITLSGNSFITGPVTIGTGIEFRSVNDYFNFDFTDFSLTISLTSAIGNGAQFKFDDYGTLKFTGFDDKITKLTLSEVSPTFSGSLVSNYTFADHSISLDFSKVTAQNKNSTLVFNINTASDPIAPGASVPEPASAALLGLGLLAVATARRKFAKK